LWFWYVKNDLFHYDRWLTTQGACYDRNGTDIEDPTTEVRLVLTGTEFIVQEEFWTRRQTENTLHPIKV
jgi:hypothetical protein